MKKKIAKPRMRGRSFTLRLNSEEFLMFQASAKRGGFQGVSEMVRYLVRRYAEEART